jgi:hypothetical protein
MVGAQQQSARAEAIHFGFRHLHTAPPVSVSRLQQSNPPRRTPPLFQHPHIHYHSFISAGPTFMSSPHTASRSWLPKLQPGGRQKQTGPQESPLPSRAHANPGHCEGSTHSITLRATDRRVQGNGRDVFLDSQISLRYSSPSPSLWPRSCEVVVAGIELPQLPRWQWKR